MFKVSVIVPVYNKEKEIEKCIKSILNQSLSDIEIIIVNDGSKDKSLKIIEKYKEKYPTKIKIVSHVNSGIGYTRNRGIDLSNGEYLSFVDGDDFIEPDMLLNYYNFCKKNNLDVCTGYYNKVTKNRKEIFKNEYFDFCNIRTNPNLINLLDYGPCNKFFKGDLIRKNKIYFDENNKYEDMPFVSKAISISEKVGHINESYYNYYIRENSETTTMDKRVFDILNILSIVNDNYKSLKNTKELEYLNIDKITTYMLQQKYQKDKNEAKKFIDCGYKTLNNNFPNWRENEYFKNISKIKQIIKRNKFILKFYVNICGK